MILSPETRFGKSITRGNTILTSKPPTLHSEAFTTAMPRLICWLKIPISLFYGQGYAFSKEYKQGRGHFYAIEDIRHILRTGAPKKPEDGPQPGTCWTCKSPDVPRMMNQLGIEKFYKTKWSALGPEITNFIGCADCHNPKDQSLTITRPALVEAYERQGKNIRKASLNEMRMLVCAQCHVEY